ncbi:SDR family NAD(P)-dependent oxidoreductase [Cohnella faecalis]|nr:SDR family oxidoreductase [Cohnella faecalis]
MKFANKSVIVTGSTSGIGKEIAFAFASQGADIAIIGRNADKGKEAVDTIRGMGRHAVFIATDLTNEASVKKMADEAMRSLGRVDVLVNNAGHLVSGAVPDIRPEDWHKTWQTNVTSVYLACHYLLPHMLNNRSGAIVNIASETALKGYKNRAAYGAAKAAVISLTKSMAVDHSEAGIRVNCLCPGTVETEMFNHLLTHNLDPNRHKQAMLDRRLTPFLGTIGEVAKAVLFLADPDMNYMTGSVLTLDGGSSVK